MTNTTNLILNEKEYVEQILDNCVEVEQPYKVLWRIAKYYFYEGYPKKEIPKLLESFVLRNHPNANMVKLHPYFERIAKHADKYTLVNILYVPVTESELAKISELDSVLKQRLMFTLVCLAKYGNAVNEANRNWLNRDDRDIFLRAGVNVSSMRRDLMLNDLCELGYIGFSRIVDNTSINIKIIDDDSPTALRIVDFRNLGNQYMRLLGGNYLECESCGLVVKRKSNSQKYCQDCASYTSRTAQRMMQ